MLKNKTINRIENQNQLQSINVYFTKGEIIQDLKLYTNANACVEEIT